MHNIDLDNVLEYLKALDDAKVDAVISSSIYIIKLVKKYTKMEAHASTQLSISNIDAVKLFEKIGADRVVLARELTLDEIEKIRRETKIKLEVFIHGGMCASSSGRCMLSNNTSNRDANRGGCAHSCRWNYNLYDNGKKINPDDSYFSLSSKDLCAVNAIPRLINLGVNSFKIEGRMKSLHYIATITNSYKKLIDDYYKNNKIESFKEYQDMINKAENRLTSTGFLFHEPEESEQLFDDYNSPTKEFVGIIKGYDKDKHLIHIEQRNYFLPNSILEVFTPDKSYKIKVGNIYDKDGNLLDAARHPKQDIFIEGEEIPLYSLLRLT